MLARILNFFAYCVVSLLPVAAGGGIGILMDARVQVFALVGLAWAVLESSIKPEQFARNWFHRAWVALALGGVIVGITISVYEYRHLATVLPRVEWLTGLGVAIAVLGLAVRYTAIRTLGKFFSHELKVQSGHRIVQAGLYKYLRHPSYTGFGLVLVGLPLILCSWFGVLAMLVLVIGGFSIRIGWEEGVLVQHFGDEYREYQKRTKRLIPFVW